MKARILDKPLQIALNVFVTRNEKTKDLKTGPTKHQGKKTTEKEWA